MADGDGTDEKPEEKPKETPKMPDLDFRTAAKNAGYALVPEADLKGLQEAQESLKTLRSVFPEEARGKESDFIGSLQSSAGKVAELETQVKSAETLSKENADLKGKNEELVKSKKLSDMWGHLSRIQQVRNVRVHDKFIDEQKLVDFPLDKHDLSKPDGVKSFAESVWKDVLEPAHKEQASVIEQVGGSSQRREQQNDDGKNDDEKADDTPSPWAFGSRA